MIEQHQENPQQDRMQHPCVPQSLQVFTTEQHDTNHILPSPVVVQNDSVEAARRDLPAVAIVSSNTPPMNHNNIGANSTLRSPLLTAPIDSPRHSIILQPPPLQTTQETPIIVGQVSV